ncbi:hypothetical protein [Halorarum halobium]|uniref:hypothetical protein n=1 Tax=Halorarum halobium TaxID=3075121 RepID=UPI0028A934BF|nr:hypothetical protein [Halobaculum sp. XH14]
MSDGNPTRRGALALAGGVLLAGCGDLRVPGSGPTTLNGTDVRAVVADREPAVPETFPVEIDDGAIGESRSRARNLLDELPTPLGPAEVPNGVIREDISFEVENAEAELSRANDPASTREGLAAARSARVSAMRASATWRAIEGDVTRGDLETASNELERALADLHDHVSYVGEDPGRAVAVHAALEGFRRGATARLERPIARPGDDDGVQGVGRLAARLEGVRGLLEHARVLYDAFVESLAEPRDLTSGLETAAESSTAELRAGAEQRSLAEDRDAASYVERDVDDTPATWALSELKRASLGGVREDADVTLRPAGTVLAAGSGLAALAGFDAVRSSVEDGTRFGVADADDVRERRGAAVDAIERARTAPAEPALTAALVPEIASYVEYGDRLVDRGGTEIRADALSRPVGHYVTAMAKAGALESATERVADALDR